MQSQAYVAIEMQDFCYDHIKNSTYLQTYMKVSLHFKA